MGQAAVFTLGREERDTVITGINVGKFGINVEKNGTKKVHF